jgi:hypothetical protein
MKQKVQARSSSGAELIATEECSTYVAFMRHLCRELGIHCYAEPTIIAQDNKSSIIMALQGGTFRRTKHMIGKLNYLKQRLTNGDARLQYLPATLMLADMPTKPVSRDILSGHMRAIKRLDIISLLLQYVLIYIIIVDDIK